jgi:hypothetical protein
MFGPATIVLFRAVFHHWVDRVAREGSGAVSGVES